MIVAHVEVGWGLTDNTYRLDKQVNLWSLVLAFENRGGQCLLAFGFSI